MDHTRDHDRRRFLQHAGLAAAGVSSVALLASRDAEAGFTYQQPPIFSVTDYSSFQHALDAAASFNGAIVFVPAGRYVLSSGIRIHANVTLQGVFSAPPSYYDESVIQGSVLEFDVPGTASSEPFITMGPQSAIRGLTIYDRRQTDPSSFVSRPWFIRGGSTSLLWQGIGIAIQDILMVNPYRGIDLASRECGRHYLRGIYGQPLSVGISVDQSKDTGRIQDVHFWDFWASAASSGTRNLATALLLGQSDWQLVHNFFAWRYAKGISFTGGASGVGTSGQFTNVMFDQPRIGIEANVIAPGGVQFSNLTVASGPESPDTMDRIAIKWLRPTGTGQAFGPLTVVNGSFWGPPVNDDYGFPPFKNAIALADGPGLLQVSSSHFKDWKGSAIHTRNQARLIATGNYFEDNQGWQRNAVLAESTSYQTVVTSNQVLGNTVSLSTPYSHQSGNI